MDNRRLDYRHPFADRHRSVLLFAAEGAGEVAAPLVDLSVGGMGLCWVDGVPPPSIGTRFRVRVELPGRGELELPAEVVHAQGEGRLGLRFLPAGEPAAQEKRDKKLWSYLLEEQRESRRRRMREAG